MALPAIATSGLARRFGAVQAVADLGLLVPEGSVYGFLGPNGAGKTTTIRLLLGLCRPDAGRITLLGEPVTIHGSPALARVGALVEAPSLYGHLTGRENIDVSRRLLGLPKTAVDRVLGIVQLRDAAGRTVAGYSQGMRQRLGIALAMLAEPTLLILDEPTNGLDPQGILEMRELIRDLPSRLGVTVFLSSHLLSEIEQVATAIGIVQTGRLRFQGSAAELLATQTPRIEVGVDRPVDAARLLAREGWHSGEDGGLLRVAVSDARAEASRIAQCLVGAGHAVWRLTEEHRSLEDHFLALTSEGAGR